jgi:hypothetical protein
MKKLIYLIIVMLVLGLLLPAAAVAVEPQSQSGGMVFPLASVLLLDGSWVILDEEMAAPAFFSGPWTWDSELPVEFTITDLYVVTDRFKVYDGGSFVIETPNIDDWDVLGLPDPFDSPPFTTDPDTALADGRFSSALIIFASGSHSITIEDIHIPPTGLNGPFIDGTVAFKAEKLSVWPIDIKPWSDPNSINSKSKGVIPVAILGSDIFDVTTVDVTSLGFGPGDAEPVHDLTDPIVYADHLQDVNLDGYLDLVCHFKTQESGLAKGDTDAILTGATNDGGTFTGTDSVNIVK